MDEIVCRETAANVFEPEPTRAEKRKAKREAKLSELAKQRKKDIVISIAFGVGYFSLWLTAIALWARG